MTQARAVTLNALSLYAVALVLAAAFAAQFMLHELPCPLCLLQRVLFATLAVGPILMGPRAPAHILAPSVTSRGIVNMAAIAASEAVAAEA